MLGTVPTGQRDATGERQRLPCQDSFVIQNTSCRLRYLSVVYLGGSWLRRFCFCLRLRIWLFLLLALSCAFCGSGSLAFVRALDFLILSDFFPGFFVLGFGVKLQLLFSARLRCKQSLFDQQPNGICEHFHKPYRRNSIRSYLNFYISWYCPITISARVSIIWSAPSTAPMKNAKYPGRSPDLPIPRI